MTFCDIYLPGDIYTDFNFGRNHSTFFGVKTTGKFNVKISKKHVYNIMIISSIYSTHLPKIQKFHMMCSPSIKHMIKYYHNFLLKSVNQIQVWLKSDKITGTLHEGLHKFINLADSFELIKFQKRVNVKIKTCISLQKLFFLKNNSGYKTIISTKQEPENAQIIQHNLAPHIHAACWVIQAKVHIAVNTYGFTLD